MRFVGALLLLMACALEAGAAKPSSRPAILIDFSPRASDAPQGVVIAGARGGVAHPQDPGLRYAVLAPQQRLGPQKYARAWGVTAQRSPSLFWFTTKPTSMKCEIRIFKDEPQGASVIRRVEWVDALACGMQRLDPKKLGVELKPGGVYRWSVRYLDASGEGPESEALLICLGADDPRVASLAALTGEERLKACAAGGVWYDLLETLSDMIEADPTNAVLREARLRCLESRTANLSISAWISASNKPR